MAWDDEMVTVLRGLLQDYADPDTGDPPKYSDARLAEMILIAAQSLTVQATFANAYTVNIPNTTLRPDPTSRGSATIPSTRDDNFINLVTLKAACMLATAEVREVTAQGISIRDGTSAIALQRSPASLKLMQDTYCKQFNDAFYAFKVMGTEAMLGEMVLGPHGCSDLWGSDYPYLGPCSRNDRR